MNVRGVGRQRLALHFGFQSSCGLLQELRASSLHWHLVLVQSSSPGARPVGIAGVWGLTPQILSTYICSEI